MHNVYTELRKISGELISEVAKKAPGVMDEMINEADVFLQGLKKRAEEILIANIDSEINYIFTNDETYLSERTKLIPTQDKPSKADKEKDKKKGRDDSAPLVDANSKDAVNAGNDTKENREKLKK